MTPEDILKKIPRQLCPHCQGSGWEWNSVDVGAALSALRLLARLKQTTIAGDLDMTSQVLCDLEQGRRRWTRPLVQRYLDALLFAAARPKQRRRGDPPPGAKKVSS